MLSKIMTVMQRGGGQALRRSCIGAIFIEFAFAIPVLIAIIYYLHDVPKYKRMQAKMNFCAHCAVNMIQNNRTKITKSDLAKIFSAAFLTVFPGKGQFGITDKCSPLAYVFYVRGEDNGRAGVIWMWDSGGQGSSPFSNSSVKVSAGSFANSNRPVRYKTGAPKEIYENLSIRPGEVKMIVLISRVSSSAAVAKKMLEFYVINPSPYGMIYLFYFATVLVFTPNPGLFSETAPG
ncbi:MAG: hypothetical protein LBJ96_01880 [Holosporaceae bacterium]|jgi:hypothetical protein|nr:hypothetical protein [Holosporaceae bacterium]